MLEGTVKVDAVGLPGSAVVSSAEVTDVVSPGVEAVALPTIDGAPTTLPPLPPSEGDIQPPPLLPAMVDQKLGVGGAGEGPVAGPVAGKKMSGAWAKARAGVVVHKLAKDAKEEKLPSQLKRKLNQPDTDPDFTGAKAWATEQKTAQGAFGEIHLNEEYKRRAMIEDEEYDVAIYCYEPKESWFASIALNHRFGQMTLFMVIANALWIGFDADNNAGQDVFSSELIFQIGECSFIAFFTFEIVVRVIALKNKAQFLSDFWMRFDFVLVVTMYLEAFALPQLMNTNQSFAAFESPLRSARLLRLIRLVRLTRLVRSMPELMIIVLGMRAAVRSVISTLLLIGLNLYIFAIAFRISIGGDPDPKAQWFDGWSESLEEFDARTTGVYRFRSIEDSVWTLMCAGTLLDDATSVINDVKDYSFTMVCLFMVYVLITNFTLLSMLVGVLCEVVANVADQNKEEIIITFVKSTLEEVLRAIDQNNDGTISEKEFTELLAKPEVEDALSQVGVNVDNLAGLKDFFFHSDSACEEELQLSWTSFLETVLSLRSTNNATVLDITQSRHLVKRYFLETRDHMNRLENRLQTLFYGAPKKTLARQGTTNPEKLWARGMDEQRGIFARMEKLEESVDKRLSRIEERMEQLCNAQGIPPSRTFPTIGS
jgi:voltage-gated sodium channel